MAHSSVTIIGAGLVGTLLACLLARRGFAVDVFEKRDDPRCTGFEAGRSINLALAERGLHALREAGLGESVIERAVMMRGRMIHPLEGHALLQRYGPDDSEVIWSVSRDALSLILLETAEAAGVRFHFCHTLLDVDFEHARTCFRADDRASHWVDTAVILGADGAGSALRAAMGRHASLGERVEWLGHGYKELHIPPRPAVDGAQSRFALEPHALHIWPRGGYMCIALPNTDGSFTVTLFLPNEGSAPSFASIKDSGAAVNFFESAFPDLLALMPAFVGDYQKHPLGMLGTLHLQRWHLGGQALLLGDAAHAIVPFHGQGMNCGFEDAQVLAELMDSQTSDYRTVFAEFQRRRQPNADAIAQMALENYVEMRDSVADARYLAKRVLGQQLAAAAPQHFMARYRMVTFTRLPYTYALERGRAQDALLEQLLRHGGSDQPIDAAVQTLRATLPILPQAAFG